MKTFIRTALAGTSVAALALMTATSAVASSLNLTNTGNNALMLQGTGNTTGIMVSNTNQSLVNQSSVNSVNTGGNDANRNIGNTAITTGQASASSTMSATTNTNQTSIDLGDQAEEDEVIVVNTGDDLSIVGGSGNSLNLGVVNHNQAAINQFSMNQVHTGGNDANRNIAEEGSVNIDTGDASVANVMATQANANLTNIEGLAFGSALVLDVTNTGDNLFIGCDQPIQSPELVTVSQIIDEEPETGCGDSLAIGVLNSNALAVNQVAINQVKTGGNDANRNIAEEGETAITTGDASVMNSMSVVGNTNTTAIDVDQLLDEADDEFTVTNTGDGLVLHLGGTSSTTALMVTNTNMLGGTQFAFNKVKTGGNDANRNIGSASVMTGNGNATNVFSISANANQTGIGMMPNALSLWGLLLSL